MIAEIGEWDAWLIFLLPLASFALIAFVIRPFFNRYSSMAGYLTILTVGAAALISLFALASLAVHENELLTAPIEWLTVGGFVFSIGVILDPLTGVMLVAATLVSLMVQIYSVGYMRGDPGYARYYAFMSLFTASMVGLVIASNVIQLYIFWELVGLCSYLLIGFWYERPAAAAAAKKAFIMTRLGDFGFLLAILYLFMSRDAFAAAGLNPLMIPDIIEAVQTGVLSDRAVMLVSLGIFAGAVGKSAQFPLHTWLPDAMEGPTPVSALIHAATMVAAGVFLVARFFPVFEASPAAMTTVAVIGGVTAIFAASMGLVANDIKRVLAYSTVSQLGYMMLALGVGAYSAALFHLFTHAFFKALLFLGSGSVNHATGTFDMRYMGGLRRVMPWTYATFLIGSLSLAGIFPLAGFWSKDEILALAWAQDDPVSRVVFVLGTVAVFMTAFYMFRAVFMTFNGRFRGGAEADPGVESGEVHLGESPLTMVAPLVVLAVASLIGGFLANPSTDLVVIPIHWLTDFVGHGPAEESAKGFNVLLAAVSSLIAVAGIGLAFLMYQSKWVSSERAGRLLRPAHVLLSRKYYFDEAYETHLVGRYFYGGAARLLDWFDKSVVDRTAGIVGWFGANLGSALRQAQSGQLQGYGAAISVGIVFIVGLYILFL